MLRSECCNYSVGPWVSGSGRETALARGNPVKRRNFNLRFSNFDCFDVSVFNRQSKIDIRKYKMPIRYGRFEMPKTLSKDESTATDTYAKFTAEPFEAGYGHTVGNSLRRVLLSSLEGAAITAVNITGAQHEFATLPSVVEDVTDIVLNLKKVRFKADGQDHEPKKLSLVTNKEGEVTAGDIQTIQGFEVLNPKQVICTLDRKHKFDAELDVRVGRG